MRRTDHPSRGALQRGARRGPHEPRGLVRALHSAALEQGALPTPDPTQTAVSARARAAKGNVLQLADVADSWDDDKTPTWRDDVTDDGATPAPLPASLTRRHGAAGIMERPTSTGTGRAEEPDND